MDWSGLENTSGLSYIVVDEIEGNMVGLAVCEWPRTDEKGRLRFHSSLMLVGVEREAFEHFLNRHRAETRPLRIGDVFAARTRTVEADDAGSRLEPCGVKKLDSAGTAVLVALAAAVQTARLADLSAVPAPLPFPSSARPPRR